MQRILLFCSGLTVFILGLLLFPLPLPLGIPLILIGLSLMVSSSLYVRQGLRWLRQRYPHLSERLDQLKHRMPGFIRHMIERTHPHHHEDTHKLP